MTDLKEPSTVELCHHGCGRPSAFWHKKTGEGRCSKNVSSCPTFREQKVKRHAENRVVRLAREAEEDAARVPQPCQCGAPGTVYDKRKGRWRCQENAQLCPAVRTKYETTLLQRYGTTKMAYIDGVQERRSEFLREWHAGHTQEERNAIRDKRTATIEERFGVSNIGQHAGTRARIKANNKIKYGVEHTLQVKAFRDQGVATMLETYGAAHPAHVPEIVERKKATMLERHGAAYPYQSPAIRQQFYATMLERHGTAEPMHVPELFDRRLKGLYRTKLYELPSGNIVEVQGYEPQALDYLFGLGFSETEVKVETRDKPVIDWIDGTGRKRKYYPDLYIEDTFHIIEVKSYYTLYDESNNNRQRNYAKRDACLAEGYRFTFLVFSNKGELIEAAGHPITRD